MTTVTTIEVDFPENLDQDKVADLTHLLGAHRAGPGVTSIGILTLGDPPTRSVQFVCQGDQPTQSEMDTLAMLIVSDALEEAGFNPDSLHVHKI